MRVLISALAVASALAAPPSHWIGDSSTILTQESGYQYYRLTYVSGAEPVISSVETKVGEVLGFTRPESVQCDAENEAYCNGALLGDGPASWNNNCRGLGIKLTDVKSSITWKYAAAHHMTSIRVHVSSTGSGTAQYDLEQSRDGESWSTLKGLTVAADSCGYQTLAIQTVKHCVMTAKDWSNWGDCTVKCGGGTQTRNATSLTQEPSAGGNGCEAQLSKFQRNCNTHMCPCSPGSFHDSRDGGKCHKCSTGKYQPNWGRGDCMSCRAGEYSDVEGAITCSKCAVGTASALPARQDPCPACPSGEYMKYKGNTKCQKCHQGTYIPDFGVEVRDGCTLCDAGTHNNEMGQASCKSCPFGSWQSKEGAWECVSCGKGRFSNANAATSPGVCRDCPTGQWSDEDRTSSCVKCLEGYFNPGTGAPSRTACTQCPKGTSSDEAGAVACTSCSEGTYAAREGSTMCEKCAAGWASDAYGATSIAVCKECQKGTYSAAGDQVCTKCPAGTFGDSKGAQLTECRDCGPGKHSLAGSSWCTNCEMGRYNHKARRETCYKCDAGTFGYAEQAQTPDVCRPCTSGKFAPEAGASQCWECGRGRFQPDTGAADCRDCAKGTYSSVTGADSSGYKTCKECPVGQYQPLEGQAHCVQCPPNHQGTYILPSEPVIGATSSERCNTCTKPLPLCPRDCKVSEWGTWSRCSKTCGTGVRKRTRRAIEHAANGGNECHTNPGSEYSLVDEEECSVGGKCPVDCVIVPFEELDWSQCTKKCGGGRTSKTSRVTVADRYGGKACPSLIREAACNEHACLSDDVEEGSAVCHADHVRCRLISRDQDAQDSDPVKKDWKSQICGRNNPALPHFNSCSEQNRGAYGEHPNPEHENSCHMCDRSFCPKHGNCKRMEIEHFDYRGRWETVPNKRDGTDNVFQAGANKCANPREGCVNPIDNAKFKCVQTSATACECHCNKHKQCCEKGGMRIQATTGSELKGNTIRVDSVQACCNLCTNHPMCKGWTYRDSYCELRREVAMEPGFSDEIAGLRSGEAC